MYRVNPLKRPNNDQSDTNERKQPVIEVPESPVKAPTQQSLKPPSTHQKRPTSFYRSAATTVADSNGYSNGHLARTDSSNGNADIGTANNSDNNKSQPFPMLFSSYKNSNVTGNETSVNGSLTSKVSKPAESSSEPERLVSLSDRFSYRPGGAVGANTGGASTVFSRYSALLEGNKAARSGSNGKTVVNNSSSRTTSNGNSNGSLSSLGMTSDEKLVQQLFPLFTSPIETVRLAVKVYRSYDAAVAWLTSLEANRKVAASMTSSGGVSSSLPAAAASSVIGMTAKREVSKPTLSIRDKFSSSAANRQQQQNRPLFADFIDDDDDERHASSPVVAQKPKRRLVKVYDEETFLSDDDSEAEEEYLSASEIQFEERLLEFLNTGSLEDIVDISSCTEEHAQLLIDARPLATLSDAKAIDVPVDETNKSKKRRGRGKPVGEKIVDSSYSVSIYANSVWRREE